MKTPKVSSFNAGFTLVELLVVVAVIGILAALIIAAVTNAASDSRLVIARQQQAVMQEALNSWITSQSSSGGSLATARATYASASNALGMLSLISRYLAPGTYSEFITYSTNNPTLLQSSAMVNCGVGLQFSTWTLNTYPEVDMVTH